MRKGISHTRDRLSPTPPVRRIGACPTAHYTEFVPPIEPPTELPEAELPSPELIEKFRQTGIRLDRQGRLWHEGTRITHPGLERALLRWLDVREDGRDILRLDHERYAYIDVEDAHLLVLSAEWQGERAWLVLNDGTREELRYDSMCVADDDALYCRVRDGKLLARVTTPAYYTLAEHIVALDDVGAAFALDAGGQRFPIQPRSDDQS
jgi:hypothetical protein